MYQYLVIFVCLQEFSPPLARSLILVLSFSMKVLTYLLMELSAS
jgi:hypothetical protein